MRSVGVAIAALGFGCGRLGFDPSEGGGGFRKPLTYSPTAFTGTVTGLPVPVRIAADPDLARTVGPDAADIYFKTATGVHLPFEIEVYDPPTGALTAWVRLPEVTSGTPVTIHMFYGWGDEVHDPAETWSDFAGVWHLGVAGGAVRDSAGDAHGQLEDAPQPAVGIAGPCLQFDGVDDGVLIPRPTDGRLDFGDAPFAVSMWVHATANLDLYDTVWWKGGSSGAYKGYTFELGTMGWEGALNDGGFYTGTFGASADLLGRWVYLAMARDPIQLRFHADGTGVDTVALAGITSIASTEPASIAENYRTGNFFQGQVDEVRVHAVERSGEWLLAEHESLASPTYLTIGPEEF